MATGEAASFAAGNWKIPVSVSVWAGLTVVAAIVLSRRTAGAFTQELSALTDCLIAVCAVALSLVANLLFQSATESLLVERDTQTDSDAAFSNAATGKRQLAAGVATLVPPFVLAIALMPRGSAFMLFFLISLFFAASVVLLKSAKLAKERGGEGTDGAITRLKPRREGRREHLPDTGDRFAAGQRRAGRATNTILSVLRERIPFLKKQSPPPGAATSNGDWTAQRFVRYRSPDGSETIECEVALPFAPGCSQQAVHVPFSPSLTNTPEVSCHILEGASARARVTASKTYGTRVEVKRTGESTDALTVRLSVSAMSSNRRERDAGSAIAQTPGD